MNLKRSRRSLFCSAAIAISVVVLGTLGGPPPATAVSPPELGIVSPDPADWTPQVMDGQVNAIVQIGNTVFAGGSFSAVREAGSTTDLPRNNLFAFDAESGEVSTTFAPDIDGAVEALEPSTDRASLYVGGDFASVNGVTSTRLARLNISDGAGAGGFTVPSITGTVRDLRVRGGTLLLGGSFTHVGGSLRPALASLDAVTGSVTSYVGDLGFDTTRTGTISVKKMDMTPDQSVLMVVGNFTSIEGQAREQMAKFDLLSSGAVLSSWSTDFYSAACSSKYDAYMRDLDISPDGSFLVVTTTGAYGGSTSPCDTVSRWEIGPTGAGQVATWVAYSGGDTTYAVSVTGPAVYIGGHFRWWNNPFAGDAAGPGAVPRSGLAALDPRSGIPLAWNPGRDRGVGVFDLLPTATGLWFGSDTDQVYEELHRKIAFFPLAGGSTPPMEKLGALPNDVYLVGSPTNTQNTVRRMFFDGTHIPSNPATLTGPEAWSSVRGAMLIGNQLFTGSSTGTLTVRTFDGANFGARNTVNLYLGSFGSEVANVSGMFYDMVDARVYYTLSGGNSLYWRGFSPESMVVGAARFTATGDISVLNPGRMSGMFLHADRLYFADSSDGNLYSIGFHRGVLTGPVVLADSSTDWRARGAFLWNGTPASVAPSPGEPDTDTDVVVDTWGSRPPVGGTAPDAVDPAPRVKVKVKSTRNASRLRVNVNPNKGKGYWRFRVLKKEKNGSWKPIRGYRTRGPKETRTVNLPRGTYRVRVYPKYGLLGATSPGFRLKR